MAEEPVTNETQPDATTDSVDAAEQALAETEQAVEQVADEARNVDLPNFQQVLADVEASGLNLLQDVDLNVKIELGRTHMLVEDVLRLNEGSVVELDKLAGDPVDVFVNERLVARGEVIVLNDNFCVRISEVVGDETPDAAATDSAGPAPTESDESQADPQTAEVAAEAGEAQ